MGFCKKFIVKYFFAKKFGMRIVGFTKGNTLEGIEDRNRKLHKN